MNYLKQFSTVETPQDQPLPGQVENSAGGYSWDAGDFEVLRRFLVLGSEGGSYYAGEQKLTVENARNVLGLIQTDGLRVVDEVVAISQAGRAPKNDPAIFALAMAAKEGNDETRAAALRALPEVCRIGTHLFQFAGFIEQFGGWGRGTRRAVGRWYTEKDPDQLAYQLVKYRQRGGWTHRDLLRLSHPKVKDDALNLLLGWVTDQPYVTEGDRLNTQLHPALPEILRAYELAVMADSPKETADLIRRYPDLPREALQSEHLRDPKVWEALLEQDMPMTALLRNLATLARVGVIAPMSSGTARVVEQLADEERLRKARAHPLSVLVALNTFQGGRSIRGDATWEPVPAVTDALDRAFYASFGNVEPTGKRIMLAVDVSGSMSWTNLAGMPGITPRVGAAALALVTAAVEPQHHIMAFSHELVPVSVSPRQRLDDVLRTFDGIPMGGTDCALPMVHAERNRIPVDAFIVLTDSETWHGGIHPAEALDSYRRSMGIPAKLIVVGMEANRFSIARPEDPGMLDVVGFDTVVPNVMSEFIRS